MSVTIKNSDTACSRCGSVALQRADGAGLWECAGCRAYRWFGQPESRADEIAYRRNGQIVIIVEKATLTPERIADVRARFGPVEVVSAPPPAPVIVEFVRRSANPRSATRPGASCPRCGGVKFLSTFSLAEDFERRTCSACGATGRVVGSRLEEVPLPASARRSEPPQSTDPLASGAAP